MGVLVLTVGNVVDGKDDGVLGETIVLMFIQDC
jgi:hypothetical protein